MRGTGLVGWGDEVVYAYFTVHGGVTRVRLSVDEADRLGALEGLRVAVALPGAGACDGLIVRVRREPPFAWVELVALAARGERRTG
jgi:hypothetical protein